MLIQTPESAARMAVMADYSPKRALIVTFSYLYDKYISFYLKQHRCNYLRILTIPTSTYRGGLPCYLNRFVIF